MQSTPPPHLVAVLLCQEVPVADSIPFVSPVAERIETPYSGMTTPDVVAARDSLTMLGERGGDAAGDLVVWATIELAERLSAFVREAAVATEAEWLAELAYAHGVVSQASVWAANDGPRALYVRKPDGSVGRVR